MLPKYIFCRCMKPWKICIDKKNSPRIDVRELIDINSLKPQNYYYVPKGVNKYIPLSFLDYDFINKKWMLENFECRFRDKNK